MNSPLAVKRYLYKCNKSIRPAKFRHSNFLVLLLLSLFFVASASNAQEVPLGQAKSFVVLGGTAITNTGASVITGNLGIAPGNASSVTGFPPGQVIGSTYFADAIATAAQTDLVTAYNALSTRACGATITADLAGMTLTPGVYCSASSMGLTGQLTLDAAGNPDAQFIFKMPSSTLTINPGSSVQMINGGQNCNVFWQVGSSATIDTTAVVIGNVIALSSITVNNGASVDGRLLARNGAATLSNNRVSICSLLGSGVGGTNVSLSKAFNPNNILVNGISRLTVSLNNPNPSIAVLTAALVDNLPSNVFIAPIPNVASTCMGTAAPIAVAGSGSVTLPAGRSIPASGSCTLSVDVTSALVGTYINTLPINALMTSNGNNPAPASATLIITATPQTIPTLSTWALLLLVGVMLIFGMFVSPRFMR